MPIGLPTDILNSKLTLVTGHYGCGKTNLCLSMARTLKERHGRVFLIDLDIANPFFRSTDFAEELATFGIECAGPVFANTNLDAPALSPAIYAALEDDDPDLAVLVDVGGDDEGAQTLARFQEIIEKRPYRMLYLVNRSRLQTSTPEEALQLMREIEGASRLRATDIVGNTHMKEFTTPELIVGARAYTEEVAATAGLPVAFLTAPRLLADETWRLLAAQSDAMTQDCKTAQGYDAADTCDGITQGDGAGTSDGMTTQGAGTSLQGTDSTGPNEPWLYPLDPYAQTTWEQAAMDEVEGH